MRGLRSRGLIGLLVIMVCASMLSIAQAVARGPGRPGGAPGDFDYYLMALSWSPSYCLTHANETEQCGGKGFGFVLHGLWPQSRNGKWIQDCAEGSAPDAATIERTLAFMPSRRLIEHEWQMHGTCTGLDPKDYFELADRAFAGVRIPPALATPQSPPELNAIEIVRGFVAVNPGLDERMLSVVCHDGSELVEVRVCLDKETLAPQACGGRIRNTCRSGALKIPAAR